MVRDFENDNSEIRHTSQNGKITSAAGRSEVLDENISNGPSVG
jgi:hypothetical protein